MKSRNFSFHPHKINLSIPNKLCMRKHTHTVSAKTFPFSINYELYLNPGVGTIGSCQIFCEKMYFFVLFCDIMCSKCAIINFHVLFCALFKLFVLFLCSNVLNLITNVLSCAHLCSFVLL